MYPFRTSRRFWISRLQPSGRSLTTGLLGRQPIHGLALSVGNYVKAKVLKDSLQPDWASAAILRSTRKDRLRQPIHGLALSVGNYVKAKVLKDSLQPDWASAVILRSARKDRLLELIHCPPHAVNDYVETGGSQPPPKSPLRLIATSTCH